MNNLRFSDIQNEIEDMLDIPDSELTPEQHQAMDEYLNELGQQEAAKIDSFSRFIRQQTAIAEAMKEESQHLANKARSIQNRIDYLKRHYLAIMQVHGLKKVSGDIYSIGVRESIKVEITNLDALKSMDNPLYLKTEITYKPDKQTIKEALKSGLEIPGCQLEKSYSLNIR